MLYLIKFLYSFVLPPGLFIVLFAASGAWLWVRKGKAAGIAVLSVTLLFYLSSIALISEAVTRSLESSYAPPTTVDGDVIVVLGGGATPDTPDVNGAGNLSGSAANRLLAAVRLHERTGLPILFSGGKVFEDTGNEADIARGQLLGLGVPDSDIYAENRSLNTAQNAEYTAQMLRQHHFAKPVLVTSASHMKRSVLQFEKAGVHVVPYPADYRVSRRAAFGLNKLSPSASALEKLSSCCKEYLGILAARLR